MGQVSPEERSMTGGALADDLVISELGRLGPVLGSGGQAVIHDAPDLHLPQSPSRLVYKEYKWGHAPRPEIMRRLITQRTRLDAPLRERLDVITAWPIRVVTGRDVVLGVVLPRIPDSFFQDLVLPGSGRTETIVREVQHLFVEIERCRRIGMPAPTLEQRLGICRDFAEILSFLHSPEVDVVFGDINAKNELFRLDLEPMVMFVDCDAVRIRGSITGSPPLNTPDWMPPGKSRVLSQSTDLYKLGLFVLRCLTPGDQASTRLKPTDAADVMDPAGVALLTAAIDGPPLERPSARDWSRYLCACQEELLGTAPTAPGAVGKAREEVGISGRPTDTRAGNRVSVPAQEPVNEQGQEERSPAPTAGSARTSPVEVSPQTHTEPELRAPARTNEGPWAGLGGALLIAFVLWYNFGWLPALVLLILFVLYKVITA
jgi:hypothetical protein